MSAQHIYDFAPLGSIVRYSDGTPQPPARHTRKRAVWETTNNAGCLIRKQQGRRGGVEGFLATFTLRTGDIATCGIIVVKVLRTFDVRSRLTFTVVEQALIGSVRVLSGEGDDRELLNLAEDPAAAERWRELSGYRQAVLEAVAADELAVEFVEGRAVA
ncbi:hypothetical protein Sa4125_47700 (plasmid) [Aureimonas sp. SA4125]|uniref:hypothetical protein n=1 Tax=Aureimonas sp. SA4125 TaxID=2826993 RepID=UPI001CC72D65|nr:hypothetical protein [Aureimonas sp. SA4125]BDA87228.1 hypothetical protein Sa4125_47700 [Aureimonas sp. SA4125]